MNPDGFPDVPRNPPGYRTIGEWDKQVRRVLKGSKSKRRDYAGRPLFRSTQLYPLTTGYDPQDLDFPDAALNWNY